MIGEIEIMQLAPLAQGKQGGVASSYAAVAERASTIAAALQRHGIGPGKIVGIGLQPGIERYQVLLATFIAGACAFVIDTSQPDERLLSPVQRNITSRFLRFSMLQRTDWLRHSIHKHC